MCSSIRAWQFCYHGNILGSRPPHIKSFFGHLCRSIVIFPNSTCMIQQAYRYVSLSLWPCLTFSKLKTTTYWNQVGGDWKRVSCHGNWIFFIAIGVFPVELLVCQVSMFCTANWPRQLYLLPTSQAFWKTRRPDEVADYRAVRRYVYGKKIS